MKNTNRIQWLDSCKGFAIILVVIGHMEKGINTAGLFPEQFDVLNAIDRCLYSFHMPLFWMLAGYTFYLAYCKNRDERRDSFKKQLINSVYVYFLFSTIQWSIQYAFSGYINTHVTFYDLLLSPIRPMSPYWFTFVLIFYYLFFYYFIRLKLPETVKLLIIAVLSALGNPLDLDIVIPIRILLLHMLFFYLGIYFAKSGSMIADSKLAFSVLSILGVLALGICTATKPPYVPLLTDVLVPSLIGLLFFNLFYKLSFIGSSRFLQIIGKYSLEIYVIHCILTAGVRVILSKLGVNNCWLMLVIGTVLSVSLPMLWAFIIKRLKIYNYFFKPTALFKKADAKKVM